MIYMKPGTTKEQNILIRVMPGNPNSPNPMQQGPYAIQRSGNKAIGKNGEFININSPEAHIPLSEFNFRGW